MIPNIENSPRIQRVDGATSEACSIMRTASIFKMIMQGSSFCHGQTFFPEYPYFMVTSIGAVPSRLVAIDKFYAMGGITILYFSLILLMLCPVHESCGSLDA